MKTAREKAAVLERLTPHTLALAGARLASIGAICGGVRGGDSVDVGGVRGGDSVDVGGVRGGDSRGAGERERE